LNAVSKQKAAVANRKLEIANAGDPTMEYAVWNLRVEIREISTC
jgi:hypothetical protein